ncbi:MAG TPA: hypothetical protein VES42_11705 [Pilimelia sp.]|nr:hypothetical protein [Pilimelia sp.]
MTGGLADRDGHPLLRGRLRRWAERPGPLDRRLARHLAELRERGPLNDVERGVARRRVLGH